MADYHQFTTARTTPTDLVGLMAALRSTIAADVGVRQDGAQTFMVKKSTTWTPGEISSAQGLIDAAATNTAQVQAQRTIDAWPIEFKALVLALIDQLNVIRAALSPAKPAITPAQALQAIRDKAGTL